MGPQSKDKVHFDFDESRTIAEAQMADWEASADKAARAKERREAVRAQTIARKREFKMPNGAEVRSSSEAVAQTSVRACGGGDQQMEDA